MKYYSVWQSVFKIKDSANYRDIVARARQVTNTTNSGSIMIEDIYPSTVEHYVEYLEKQLEEANKLLNTIKTN